MADYNVTSSDGTFTVNVQAGTINNNYDVPFIGQDAINYGDDLVAAQLRQLENFSNTSPPAFGTTRVKGQLWYDSTPVTGRLSIFDGASWDIIPLNIDVVHTSGAESIDDVKTFTSAPLFSAAGAPITVNSNTVVPNLNADFLDGEHATAFATSDQGTLATNAEPSLPPNNAGAGYVLASDGPSNNYTWTSLSVSAGQIQVDGPNLTTTGSIVFVDNTDINFGTGVQDPLYASGLTYNAATSTLSTLNFAGSTFTGALVGNADTATTTGTATNATNITINSNTGAGDTATYPVLVGLNSAISQVPMTDGGQLSYDASSGALSAASFVGAGSLITALNLSSGTHTGTLTTARGGTGVNSATGSGSLFVLSTAPTFTTRILVDQIRSASGTEVVLQWASSTKFKTQDETASDQTSGAEVKDGNGNFRNVGFNDMITTSLGSSGSGITFSRANAGHSWRATNSSGTRTFATEGADGTIPAGAIWNIRNLTTSSGIVKIQGGTGSTIRHYDGSGGTPPVTVAAANPFTLARGGVATIVKVTDDEYEMWGIGLTGGA